MIEEVIDLTNCSDRLRNIADDPEYHKIRFELLHAADELDGIMELIKFEAGINTSICSCCGQEITNKH